MLNVRVIEYILSENPPPPVTTLALVLRSDWDRLHECLRAAGPALHILELVFPERPAISVCLLSPHWPAHDTLRSLSLRSPHRDILSITAHLLSVVLRAPYLESLVIDIEPGHEPQEEVFTATLELVLETLPALKSLRIYAPAAWRVHINIRCSWKSLTSRSAVEMHSGLGVHYINHDIPFSQVHGNTDDVPQPSAVTFTLGIDFPDVNSDSWPLPCYKVMFNLTTKLEIPEK
ncbi:hypothetical protein FB451DRAFT_1407477 [Mycena latifolia]|nr:hypothetical protein FB451DRAFT_1407477 [Mycena latifolia]